MLLETKMKKENQNMDYMDQIEKDISKMIVIARKK